jgi:hypothetical protein
VLALAPALAPAAALLAHPLERSRTRLAQLRVLARGFAGVDLTIAIAVAIGLRAR